MKGFPWHCLFSVRASDNMTAVTVETSSWGFVAVHKSYSSVVQTFRNIHGAKSLCSNGRQIINSKRPILLN